MPNRGPVGKLVNSTSLKQKGRRWHGAKDKKRMTTARKKQKEAARRIQPPVEKKES